MASRVRKKLPKKAIEVPDIIDPNRRYNILVGSALLDQSRAKTFRDIKTGKIAAIHDEGRTYIPGTEIIRRSTLPQD